MKQVIAFFYYFSWLILYFYLTPLEPVIIVLLCSQRPPDQLASPIPTQTTQKVGKFHCKFICLIAFKIAQKNKAAFIEEVLSVVFFLTTISPFSGLYHRLPSEYGKPRDI
jgi:hypothetical protein